MLDASRAARALTLSSRGCIRLKDATGALLLLGRSATAVSSKAESTGAGRPTTRQSLEPGTREGCLPALSLVKAALPVALGNPLHEVRSAALTRDEV